MRHDARRLPRPPSTLRSELADYLRLSGSPLSMAEAAGLAVRAWIEDDRAHHAANYASVPAPPARGYLWKTLFLPHGTLLRMQHGGKAFHAEVIGTRIMYQGRSVSPRGMTLAIAGNGRNAWRDLRIRLPGERHFTYPRRLLLEACPGHAGPGPSPPAALAQAARGLADAFTSALALGAVSQGAGKSGQTPAEARSERRNPRHRRQSDQLEDWCNFD